MAIPKSKREASEETNLPIPWAQPSSLQNYEEINFCCSHHPGWVFVMAAQTNTEGQDLSIGAGSFPSFLALI
jgi:hypothetical protein